MSARPFRELTEHADADPVRRARKDVYKRAMRDALTLAALRTNQGVTQTELAEKLAVSQANVSRIEHEEDLYLSTLREYVAALGGELELRAVFPERTVTIVAPARKSA